MVGLADIILLMGPSVLANGVPRIWSPITILGPLSYTLGAIYARRQTDSNPRVMVAGAMIIGCVVLVPLAFAVEMPLTLVPSMGR